MTTGAGGNFVSEGRPRRGMAGMLTTVWLVLAALSYAAAKPVERDVGELAVKPA